MDHLLWSSIMSHTRIAIQSGMLAEIHETSLEISHCREQASLSLQLAIDAIDEGAIYDALVLVNDARAKLRDAQCCTEEQQMRVRALFLRLLWIRMCDPIIVLPMKRDMAPVTVFPFGWG